MAVVCSACGTEAPEGQNFCGACAAPLALACPACGAGAAPGQKFCGECAQPLTASNGPAPSTASSAAHAERRLVTILFADLVAFTTLSERRDPEVVREMLERYFERCRGIIERYGGIVEKFIGDAVMAVWGSPVAREDDAERAVRAALELITAVDELGGEVGIPELRVRAGLLTGETAVRVGAEHEGMVIGDAVNTASRIQSLAEPGTVLVEDSTRRATDKAIAYADAGSHTVKGRDEPVHVWHALRVVAGVGGSGRGSGLEAPFVGRAAELRAIVSARDAVIAQRRAHKVTVLGEAGMGKSRLSWEFEKQSDGVTDVVLWHRGRCLSYGEGVSFWALTEIVRARAGILENEAPGAARDKLRATVEQYVHDERERRLVLPRLEHLLGLAEQTVDAGDLFSGWRMFLERLAQVDPVVLVFEDLQWADAGLLEFIDHLMEWSAEYPIMVLALSRPEVLERRPGWADSAHRLKPLADDEMRALLDGLIPGLPDDASARIRARSEGIPLYAVETVRMLLDRGVIRQDGDRYVVTGSLEAVEVPETLHALIASRLDGLTPAERRLVQDASVLGATFGAEGLAEISELTAGEVTRTLDGLVAKQILGADLDPRSPERGQYGFLQELLRTVAYGTLGRKDRKARHLAAAAYLERAWRNGAEDIAEVLATHYAEAVRAEPEAPDAPALRTKATDTLAEAGRRAMSFGLGSEARRWFTRAAEYADDARRQAELYELAGRGALLAAEWEDAQAAFDRARALYESLGDVRKAAVVRASGAERGLAEGAYEDALAEALAALEELGTDPVDADVAFVAGEVARMYMNTDRPAEGLPSIDIALRFAESESDVNLLAHALVTKGTLLAVVSQEEGEALIRHGLRRALEADLPAPALRAYQNLLHQLMVSGRHAEALTAADELLRASEVSGDRPGIWAQFTMRTPSEIALGDWDRAVTNLEHTEKIYRDRVSFLVAPVFIARGDARAADAVALAAAITRDSPEMDVCLASAAHAAGLIASGEPEQAISVAQMGVGAMLQAWEWIAPMVQLLDAAVAAGQPDAARPAIERVRAAGPRYDRPEVHGVLTAFEARVAVQNGATAEADALFARAADLFREAATPFPLARVLLDRAELCAAQGNDEQGRPLRDEAIDIFTALKATPWLERARGGATVTV